MQKGIEDFAKEYYRFLDSLAPLEKLQNFLNEKEFLIIKGEMIIDSLEKYENWYEETKKLFVKKEHIINSIEIKEVNEIYEAKISMDFNAELFSGDPVNIKNATINWQLIKINEYFKIKRYEINI